MKKSMTKRMETAPHETLLVLDGTTGLNMLNQARGAERAAAWPLRLGLRDHKSWNATHLRWHRLNLHIRPSCKFRLARPA